MQHFLWFMMFWNSVFQSPIITLFPCRFVNKMTNTIPNIRPPLWLEWSMFTIKDKRAPLARRTEGRRLKCASPLQHLLRLGANPACWRSQRGDTSGEVHALQTAINIDPRVVLNLPKKLKWFYRKHIFKNLF